MLHDVAEIIKELAAFKDPILAVLGLVIVMLFYLLREDRRLLSEKDACIREFSESTADCGEALAKLSTLVEVMVYGKGRRKE